jgi:ferredoxin
MRVRVDRDVCVGTGSCEALCPAVFEVGDDGISVVKADPVPPDQEKAAREAIENCPVEAIKEA